jgi:thioredoxin 1
MDLVTQILIVFSASIIGGVIGHAKLRKPLAVAFTTGLFAFIVVFIVGRYTQPVAAVETLDEFDEKVIQSERPVVVDFYADFCKPCRKLAPTIEKLADEYRGRVDFVKIDVQDSPEIAHAYGIRAIPHVILFIQGKPTHRWVGNRPTSHYRTVIDAVLSGQQPPR